MSKSAGRTISIRMPEGSVEALRAATGTPFSTLVRFIMLAYLERLKAERRMTAGQEQRDRVAAELREMVNDDAEGRGL